VGGVLALADSEFGLRGKFQNY
jgi:hypothetical protein